MWVGGFSIYRLNLSRAVGNPGTGDPFPDPASILSQFFNPFTQTQTTQTIQTSTDTATASSPSPSGPTLIETSATAAQTRQGYFILGWIPLTRTVAPSQPLPPSILPPSGLAYLILIRHPSSLRQPSIVVCPQNHHYHHHNHQRLCCAWQSLLRRIQLIHTMIQIRHIGNVDWNRDRHVCSFQKQSWDIHSLMVSLIISTTSRSHSLLPIIIRSIVVFLAVVLLMGLIWCWKHHKNAASLWAV